MMHNDKFERRLKFIMDNFNFHTVYKIIILFDLYDQENPPTINTIKESTKELLRDVWDDAEEYGSPLKKLLNGFVAERDDDSLSLKYIAADTTIIAINDNA